MLGARPGVDTKRQTTAGQSEKDDANVLLFAGLLRATAVWHSLRLRVNASG